MANDHCFLEHLTLEVPVHDKFNEPEREKKIRRTEEIAYRATSGDASSDTILCCDEKRARFDRVVQIAGRAYESNTTSEEGCRTLLGLLEAGPLG